MVELIQFKILNTAIECTLNQDLSEIGLTCMQATVIGYLKKNMDQDICPKDIKHSLGVKHPTVSGILRRMEENGMIRTITMPSDRRHKKVVLTEKAMNCFDCMSEKIEAAQKRLFKGISPEQEEQVNQAMTILIQNLL